VFDLLFFLDYFCDASFYLLEGLIYLFLLLTHIPRDILYFYVKLENYHVIFVNAYLIKV